MFLLCAVSGVLLLLRGQHASAASFEPGTVADPPTGAVLPPGGDTVLDGDGIRWEFAPLSYTGSLSVDGRWQRMDGGLRSRQGLLVGNIDFATYIWQPWFVQVRFGLGAVVSRETTQVIGSPSRQTTSPSTTGRLNVAVFPMSRFPFDLRIEQGDSRVSGDTVGVDYRTQRFAISQAYAPPEGGSHYHLLLDHARRTTADGESDTVTNLNGTATRQWGHHALNLLAQHVVGHNSQSDADTRNSALSLHHSYSPSSALLTDSLASWNRSLFTVGQDQAAFDASTDIRQVSTFASWRPAEGEWLYAPDAPVSVTGTARVVETRQGGLDAAQTQRALNLALGVSKDLSTAWRVSGSASTSLTQVDGREDTQVTNANVGVGYAPPSWSLGDWRYAPTLGANAGTSRSSRDGHRESLGLQAGHALSRPFPLENNDSLSLALSQNLAGSRDTTQSEWSRQLVHAASLSWQAYSNDATQSYASFSLSDSRSAGGSGGSFQLANLQVTRRTQLSRDASWSGSLTLQTSRSQTPSTFSDGAAVATSSAAIDDGRHAQRFYSGSLNYEHRRVFGVPRLRFVATLTLNSQQLDNRSPADLEAPREQVTKSLEGRLDYAIGKLDTHLTTRWVEVAGRGNASIFFRVQRRF